METLDILRQLAIIIIFAKLFGLIARKLHAPQVAGEIIAGLAIGPSLLGWVQSSSFLSGMSEIGVIMLMFNAGLGTNIKDLKKSGVKATLIACAGVAVPLVAGTFLFMLFYGFDQPGTEEFYRALYIGTILTATSVSITVQTLKELGKLQNFIGTTVMSAAIIDDVIGIIVLSIIAGMGGSGSIGMTLLRVAGFFVFTVGAGWVLRRAFRLLVRIYPHKRRTSIFAFAACFLFAYAAEEFFGIAAITGAYMAGLMLSGLGDSQFVDRKVIVSSYMFFTPMFFAFIGISADFSHFTLSGIWFVLAFVTAGILGKIIGCSAAARVFRYSGRDSMTAGFGMIARGEVALAVYATGQSMIVPERGIDPLVATIFLIITSSILCPILLKISLKDSQGEEETYSEHSTTISAEAIENVHHDIGQ